MKSYFRLDLYLKILISLLFKKIYIVYYIINNYLLYHIYFIININIFILLLII